MLIKKSSDSFKEKSLIIVPWMTSSGGDYYKIKSYKIIGNEIILKIKMKKNKILVLLLLTTVTMLYSQEAAGVLHTITTESSDINKSSQSINIRIRNEGIK